VPPNPVIGGAGAPPPGSAADDHNNDVLHDTPANSSVRKWVSQPMIS